MQTAQTALSNVLSTETKVLKRKIESDLPNQISRVERNMKNDQDYINTMKEKNEQLMKNHTDNDDDFIEYELDPKTKYTVQAEAQGKFEFKKNEKTGLATFGFKDYQPIDFKIQIKKPLVIGAVKVGITHTAAEAEAPKREEDDDAYLEIAVKLKWAVGNEVNELATIKVEKYEAMDTSIEDLDKAVKLVRCKED